MHVWTSIVDIVLAGYSSALPETLSALLFLVSLLVIVTMCPDFGLRFDHI